MNALAGRRVVVTRAAEQSESLVALLRERGALPVEVPLITIVDVDEGMVALTRLGADDIAPLDWVIVTSANGARRLPALVTETPGPRVAAVGSATAAALSRCDLQVPLQSAAGLLQALPAAPAAALLVQAEGAAPTLRAGLEERGWSVRVIVPYRSEPLQPSAQLRADALTADAVLFASGSAARAWVASFGTDTPPVVVAIGPQTASEVVRLGLKVAGVAADHSLAGLVASLERCLESVK